MTTKKPTKRAIRKAAKRATENVATKYRRGVMPSTPFEPLAKRPDPKKGKPESK
jgi:hypothetical protein